MTAAIAFENEIRSTLARMEAKLDMLLGSARPGVSEASHSDLVLLSSFTTKQHAIIQMILRDAPNEEIAERLKVSANTIKTHLTMIARKIGVPRKATVITTLAPIFQRVSDSAYIEASGGLPKSWDKNYSPDNMVNDLVENKG